MKNGGRAFGYFRQDKWLLAAVMGLVVAGAALNALKPWPFSLVVDCVLGTRPAPAWMTALPGGGSKTALIGWMAGLLLLLHTGQGALASVCTYFSIRIGLDGLRRVRNELLEKMTRLSLRFYHGAREGDLIYRATWDTYAFQTFFQQGLVTFLTAAISLLMMAGVMARLNFRLTLIALATAPVLAVVIRRFSPGMSNRTRAAQQADSRVASAVQQNLTAMPLIQSYTREPGEIAVFHQRTADAQKSRAAQHFWEVCYGFGVTMVFAAGTAAIVWLGGGEVGRDRLSLGELTVFLAYLAQLYEPLNQLSHVGATLAGARAGMERVFDLLDTPEEIANAPVLAGPGDGGGRGGWAVAGEIRLSGVRFSYRDGQEVLRGVDLVVQPGESVALVGPSGAGKTTLLNLLPRFFDPVSGSVVLDGVDLRNWPLKRLREQVAVVLQEPILLPASVAENIAYGRPGATLEEIRAAARAAQADAFIQRLGEGYQTVLGEGAARLSVGEKQRINLARAFLKNAPVLLLDEPTSALDAESETLVLRGLKELMKGRTTIMVAHRLATIETVNRIVVLAGGRVEESGSHEELMGRNGYYARLRGEAAGRRPE